MDKLESQFLAPDFHRKNRRLLFLAVLFIAVGGAIPIYTQIHTIPRVEAMYQGIANDASRLGANTQGEKDLLEICMSTIVAARQGWVMAASKTALAATTFMWVSGGSLLGTFLYRRRVKRIIDKYAPNQAL